MNAALANYSWPLSRLAEGLAELSQRSGLRQAGQTGNLPQALRDADITEVGAWLSWASDHLGLECESVECSLPQVMDMLSKVAPAIVRLGEPAYARFLLVLRSRAGFCFLLTPDLSVQRCPGQWLRDALCQHYEAPIAKEIDQFLTQANIPAQRRPRVMALMLEEQLANQVIAGCWMLRLPPSAPFWQQLSTTHLPERMLKLLGVFVALYLLEIGGWGLIGQAALQGRLDFGWLSAWMLLVLSLIPLHVLADWLDRHFALDFGRILKMRLLYGALQLNPDQVKQQGAGQLLGRVLESQALESLALNGGFSMLMAIIELVFAAWILANGAGGGLHLVFLLVWLVLSVVLCARYFYRLRDWTRKRLHLTHDLVERMVGHRTCLAQEPVAHRDHVQDQQLYEYLLLAQQTDRAVLPIYGGLARGWLVVALVGLGPAFIAGTANTTTLAISLGGLLLANRALSGVIGGLNALGRALIAWGQVEPLFRVPRPQPSHRFPQHKHSSVQTARCPIVTAQQLNYAYAATAHPLLKWLDLTIRNGDRILLQGASGGGKSTLAALLTGMRQPDSGLLLLNGLDYFTLGSAWHQQVSAAPQFHENHILSGTLAFNLLMSRDWPASEADLAEAQELCIALGLGPLLERMPSGLRQMVGETGWQLSHGERSRIYLARALLQNSQLTILDESFAALDPESLQTCLTCVFERSNSLLVIAHP